MTLYGPFLTLAHSHMGHSVTPPHWQSISKVHDYLNAKDYGWKVSSQGLPNLQQVAELGSPLKILGYKKGRRSLLSRDISLCVEVLRQEKYWECINTVACLKFLPFLAENWEWFGQDSGTTLARIEETWAGDQVLNPSPYYCFKLDFIFLSRGSLPSSSTSYSYTKLKIPISAFGINISLHKQLLYNLKNFHHICKIISFSITRKSWQIF